MRRLVFSLLLSMLWLGVSQSWAQTPKVLKKLDVNLIRSRDEEKKKASATPELDSLEKLVAEGLINNLDVRLAESRVKATEAVLHNTRLRVAAEISLLQADIDAAKASVDEAQVRVEVAKKLQEKMVISAEEYRAALSTSRRMKWDLASKQAKLSFLLGKLTVERQEKKTASAVQEPGSQKQQIAEGLQNNPEVRVAESRVREAEAVLQQTRMRVAAEISGLQAEIDAAKAFLDEANNRFESAQRLLLNNAIAREEHRGAELTLAKAKRELAVFQGKMPYLLGKQTPRIWFEVNDNRAGIGTMASVNYYEIDNQIRRLNSAIDSLRKPITHTEVLRPGALLKLSVDKLDASMTDKLRKALDTPIKLPLNLPEADFSLAALSKYLRENLPGISLHLHRFKHPQAQFVEKYQDRQLLTFKMKEPIPMGAFLQFVEDELNVIFILREYGVVMVPGESVPPGAIRVYEFWKLGKSEKRP